MMYGIFCIRLLGSVKVAMPGRRNSGRKRPCQAGGTGEEDHKDENEE